ncbi:T-box transcription factor TBX10-like [Branchiostoma floridae x Branchiostoma belcheri]
MSLSERAKAFSMEALLAADPDKTSENDNEELSPVFDAAASRGVSSSGPHSVNLAVPAGHRPLGPPCGHPAQPTLLRTGEEAAERDELQGNIFPYPGEADRSSPHESTETNGWQDDNLPIAKTTDGVTVSLEKAGLWRKFQECGTEMILNRAGRRMFPPVMVTIGGLDPTATYRVYLDVVPADRHRHKFTKTAWVTTGPAEFSFSNPPYEHPNSPAIGSAWMGTVVSFAKAKITNSKDSVDGNFLLHSMHKYQTNIIIVRQETKKKAQGHHGDHRHTFQFDETAFVAVTAYQNHKVTRLKIKNNPFAKAFRDLDVTAVLAGARLLTGSDAGAYQAVYGDRGYPCSGPIVMDSNQIRLSTSKSTRAKQRHPKSMRENKVFRPTPIWALPTCGFPYPNGNWSPEGNITTLHPPPSPVLLPATHHSPTH